MPPTSRTGKGAGSCWSWLRDGFPFLLVVWADTGYAGPKLGDWVRVVMAWTLVIVRYRPQDTDFEILPKRWFVERVFPGLGYYRCSDKDFAGLFATSEIWI